MQQRIIHILVLLSLAAGLLSGCSLASAQTQSQAGAQAGTPSASHSGEAEPDYAIVFPQDQVNRIDISLSGDAWSDLQSEMTALYGKQGQGGGAGNQPGGLNQGGQPAQPQQPGQDGRPGGNDAQPGQNNPPARPGGMDNGMNGGNLQSADTSYVKSTVTFNGETWNNVGFRYSGNSTLQTSWRSGTQKISFRLDFDEFEDEDPNTRNQRFFGFKQISFKSNAMDDSYLREKVTTDILRAAGVTVSQTAFYEVYVDYGDGPQYFGLYTAVEIVDDTVIKTQFADDSGNVYKPEGSGAAFVDGTFTEESFEKQTNPKAGDWSDIQAVFAALNSDLRSSDPPAWRAGLEAIFDTDAFIRWLAADTILQNWDGYGSMAHNYYLYTDPSDGLVTWIPWDFNQALTSVDGGGGRGRSARSLDLASVGDQWPLIRYLMDDPVYFAQYQQDLQETLAIAFQPDALTAKIKAYHDLIAPSVAAETSGATQLDSPEAFDQAEESLLAYIQQRYEEVQAYLASG
jgi:spore coat protein CotH